MKWESIRGFPDLNTPRTSVFKAIADGAELSLLDLNGTLRYFAFRKYGEAHITNNILTFNSEWADELSIDQNKDKRFAKKKRIDE